MLSNLLQNKLLVYLVYALLFLPFIAPWQRYLLFLLGLMLGLALLIFDEKTLHRKYNDQPEVIDIEGNSDNPPFLATRSSLFLLVLLPLSVFITTSTSGAVGIGFVLGLALGLVHEMWLYRNWVAEFGHRYLSQLKISLTTQLVKRITLGYSLFFLLISLWTMLKR